jgi:hypothetical protein
VTSVTGSLADPREWGNLIWLLEIRKSERRKSVPSRETEEYHAYLLRLWRESNALPWRAELVSPHTGEKRHFATEGQLLDFLRTLLAGDEGNGGQGG